MTAADCTFTTLTAAHLAEVLALGKDVIDALPSPDLLRRNSVQMWQRCLCPPHVALGARVGDRLVALAVLYIPQPGDDDHLAQYLLDPALRSQPSANYKICIVHPHHRGHALQQTLGLQLHCQASRLGVQLMCSTVSPRNPASIRSLEKLGYHCDSAIQKYGSERLLYFRLLQ